MPIVHNQHHIMQQNAVIENVYRFVTNKNGTIRIIVLYTVFCEILNDVEHYVEGG